MANEYEDLVAWTHCGPTLNSAGYYNLELNAADQVISQEFRVPHDIVVSRIQMFIKIENGDWPLEAGICELDGSSHPDHNNPLCSTERAFSATTGTYGDRLEFTFASPPTLTSGTTYAIYIKYGTGGTTTTNIYWYRASADRSAFIGQSYDADVYNWYYNGSTWSNPVQSYDCFNMAIWGMQDYSINWNHSLANTHTNYSDIRGDSANEWYAQCVTIQHNGFLQKLALPLHVDKNTASYKGFKVRLTGDNGSNEPDMNDIKHTIEIDNTDWTTTDNRGYYRYWDISSESINVSRGEKLWIVVGGERDGETGSSKNYIYWYYNTQGYIYGYGDAKYTSNGGSSWSAYTNVLTFKLYQTDTDTLLVDQENMIPVWPRSSDDYCSNRVGSYYWNSGRILFQTFTPANSGNLRELWLGLPGQTTDVEEEYTIRLYAADGSDQPTGAVLATQTFDPYTDRSNNSKNTRYNNRQSLQKFDFSADEIALEEGTKYGIWIQASTYHWNGMRPIYDASDKWAGGIGHDYIYGTWNAGINGAAASDMPLMLVMESGLNFTLDSSLCKAFGVDSSLCKALNLDCALCKAFNLNATLQGTIDETFPIDSVLQGDVEGDFSVDSYLKYADDETKHKVVFAFNMDSPSVQTRIDGARMLARKSRVSRVYCILENTGTTGTTKIDINVDGVSLFTDQNSRPEIEGGASTNFTERRPQTRNISSKSVITVDIDELASGASGLSVVVELNTPTSYSHLVKEFYVMDNGIVINRDKAYGYTSSDLQFKIVFDEPMDTAYTPQISWTPSSMTGTPTISGNDTWSSTYEKNDTWVSPSINALGDAYVGTAEIVISGAKNVFGDAISNYTATLELADDSLVSFEEAYTSVVNNYVRISSDIISEFRYSLDNATWSDWQTYVNRFQVDITSATIGGNASTGLKTLYVQVKDSFGQTQTEQATIYYDTSFSAIEDFKIIGTYKANYYLLKWKPPTEAQNTPVKQYIVKVDGVTKITIEDMYPHHVSGLDLTITEDIDAYTLTYGLTAGGVYDPDGNYLSFSATDLEVDMPDAQDRYDIICVNSAGELAVVEGTEGMVTRTAYNWEGQYLYDYIRNWGGAQLPNIPTGYYPLYYLYVRAVRHDDFDGLGIPTTVYLGQVGDDSIFDLREQYIQYVLYIERTEEDQTIRITAISENGLSSNYDYTFEKTELYRREFKELQAYSEEDGGGNQLSNGEIIMDTEVTDNTVYLKFVEEE